MIKSIKNPFKKAGAVLTLAALPFMPGVAHSQDLVTKAPTPTPTNIPHERIIPAPQEPQAWEEAARYSSDHHAVTFAVNGRAKNATNQQIVNYVRGKFAEDGVSDSVSFSGREDSIGVSL